MTDYFSIDIPVFAPLYDETKRYGWSRYKDDLWDLLKDTTGGYCMYCYDTVWINGQRRGQIEHGIEKINSPEYLTDCVPNLGLACENCNGKYKKRVEEKRRLPEEQIRAFEPVSCRKYACRIPCEKYIKLRKEYVSRGKIILQPFESKTHENGNVLRLRYDLLNGVYIPGDCPDTYSKKELGIIEGHIRLFGLNSAERRNREVGRYCKNVIDHHDLMEDMPYHNLVVDLFRNKLKELSVDDAVKVCKIIYSRALLRRAT